MAVTLVWDRPGLVGLFQPAGAPVKRPKALDGRSWHSIPIAERAILREWAHVSDRWHGTHVLRLMRPSERYSFWAFWRSNDWTFRNWYVNLQAPLERTSVGFDSRDYILDIELAADGSWSVKDAEEFAAACRVGRFDHEEAQEIRRAADDAVAIIESRGWPLSAGFEDWRPDPAWGIPVLPTGWDQ